MKKDLNYWIDLIKNETDFESNSAYYELIQHKTDFFLDGSFQFSAYELIIEAYSKEDETHVHNIYPELVCGDAKIYEGDLENYDFKTFIIDGTPEYDEQELTNGLSNLISGDAKDIANEILKLKHFNWNDLLPPDKKDFAYFDYNGSYISFYQAYQNDDNTINKIFCNLIGNEVFIFNEIQRLDTSIKQNVNFDNYITQQHLISIGCDKVEIPFNIKPDKAAQGLNNYNLTESEIKTLESLSIENGLDSNSLYSYLIYKDFQLPDSESLFVNNKNNLLLLKFYLELISRHSFIFFEAVWYKLKSYNVCIWEVYSELVQNILINEILENKFEKGEDYNLNRFIVKHFKNDNEFETDNTQINFSFKTDLLNEENYLKLSADLINFLNKKVESEKETEIDIEQSERFFSIATDFYQNQEWEKAIKNYDDCINSNPKKLEAFHNRALAKYEINDLDGAVSDLEEAINIEENADCYYMLGFIYDSQLSNSQLAKSYYSKCIEINSDHIKAHQNRGNIHLDNQEFENALLDYNKIISIDSSNFKAILARAMTYFEMKKYDEALVGFKKVKILNPNYEAADSYIKKINETIPVKELESEDYLKFKTLFKKAKLRVEIIPNLIQINAPAEVIEEKEISIYIAINELLSIFKKLENNSIKEDAKNKVSELFYEIGSYKMKLFEKDKSKLHRYLISIKCFEHSASLNNIKATKALEKFRSS